MQRSMQDPCGEPVLMRGGPVFKRGDIKKETMQDPGEKPAVMRGGPVFKKGDVKKESTRWGPKRGPRPPQHLTSPLPPCPFPIGCQALAMAAMCKQ